MWQSSELEFVWIFFDLSHELYYVPRARVNGYQLSVFSYQRRSRDFVALRNEAVRYAHFELKPHASRRLRRTSLLTTDY